MKIAKDIVDEIESKLLGDQRTQELLKLCKDIYQRNFNVGHDQLLRSMLMVSKFDAEKFKEIIDSNFLGDPRDVLVSAQTQNESINYGLSKFPLNE